MLEQERIPLTAKENAAVEVLLAKHPGQNATVTRRDPGETGPVLVHIGDSSYQIGKTGQTTKLKAAS